MNIYNIIRRHLSNYNKKINRLSKYCSTIPRLRLGDYSPKFTPPSANNCWTIQSNVIYWHSIDLQESSWSYEEAIKVPLQENSLTLTSFLNRLGFRNTTDSNYSIFRPCPLGTFSHFTMFTPGPNPEIWRDCRPGILSLLTCNLQRLRKSAANVGKHKVLMQLSKFYFNSSVTDLPCF